MSFTKVVLFILFAGLPFLDMVNGYLVLTATIEEGGRFSPSQLSRAFASFLLVIYVIKEKLHFHWLWVLLIGLAGETIYAVISQSINGFLFGIITVYRVVYLVLLMQVLAHMFTTCPSLVFRYLKLNLIIIAGSIILSYVLGVGFSTYGWGAGTKGFFASGNGIGLYVGILTLFLISLSFYYSRFRIHPVVIFMSISALLLIGSKTGFIFAMLSILALMLRSKYRVYLIPMLLLMFISSYNQLIIIITSFLDVVISRFANADSFLDFMASSRITYVLEALEIFHSNDPSVLRYLFGAGAYLSFQEAGSILRFDTLETDFFDMFFMYGFLGIFLYCGFIVYGIFKFRSHFYFILVWLMLASHSILAGHVLLNAMSLSLIAILMAVALNLNKLTNKRCHYDFEDIK
jgi:hypothetical protein